MTTLTKEQRTKLLHDLDTQGFAVVENVISDAECDELSEKFKQWLAFFGEGDYPKNRRSVIHGYGVAQMDPTWQIRLKAKPVFEGIFGTDKLLSSTDGVGLLPPPDPSCKADFDTGVFWLHCDQSCDKVGCHSFQGAVYLEETTPDDYCLRVLKNSHRKHQAFFNHPSHSRAKRKSRSKEFCKLTKAEVKWYVDKGGCPVTPVGVPKGGMVIWDSRVIHDTKKPSKNRENPDRWRMLTFVSMAPALWATEKDLETKKEAYENLETTAHWASRGVTILRFMGEGKHANPDHVRLQELPPIAKTQEAKRLVGVEPYDFHDDKPNGPEPPKMISDGDDIDQSDSSSLLSWLPADQSEKNSSSPTVTAMECSDEGSDVTSAAGQISATPTAKTPVNNGVVSRKRKAVHDCYIIWMEADILSDERNHPEGPPDSLLL